MEERKTAAAETTTESTDDAKVQRNPESAKSSKVNPQNESKISMLGRELEKKSELLAEQAIVSSKSDVRLPDKSTHDVAENKIESQEERFWKWYNSGWFNDLDESITRPDFLFNINGIDCVPSREITAISGKPGVGKSTTLSILAAILLGGKEYLGIRKMSSCNKILWLDTEKGAYSCKKKMEIFRRIADIQASKRLEDVGLHFKQIRGNTPDDMRYFIEKAASLEKYDVIVIDGVFDLTDDPDKHFSCVISLMQNLVNNGSTVFAMLHSNKSKTDDNMRYALGSEVWRVCTTWFVVDISNGVHTITHKKSNDTAQAPKIAFQINAQGYVVESNCEHSKDDESDRLAQEQEIVSRMEKVFAEKKTQTNSEIQEAYKKLFKKSNSKSTVIRHLQEACKLGVIRKNDDESYTSVK